MSSSTSLSVQLRSVAALERCLSSQKDNIKKGFSSSISVALGLEANKDNPNQVKLLEQSMLAYASMEREVVQLLDSLKYVQQQLKAHGTADELPNLCGWMEEKLAQLEQRNTDDDLQQHSRVVEFREKIHGLDDAGAGSSHTQQTLGDDPDADLLMSQVEVSLKCPLTQRLLEDPVQHRECKHSYSKHAIIQYIRERKRLGKAATRCPIGGCKNKVTEDDLVPNHALHGRLQKRKLL